MPAVLGIEAKSVFDVAKEMGLLAALKDKLVGSPKEAQLKLGEALAQVQAFYGVLNSELTTYLSIDLAEMEGHVVRKTLLDLISGALVVRLDTARFHCSKIAPIYQKHLKALFVGPHAKELDEMFFYKIADADDWVVKAIKEIAAWIQADATQTLALYDAKEFDEAHQRLRAAAKEFQPILASLQNAMLYMTQIQIDLLGARGV